MLIFYNIGFLNKFYNPIIYNKSLICKLSPGVELLAMMCADQQGGAWSMAGDQQQWQVTEKAREGEVGSGEVENLIGRDQGQA